MKKIIVSVLFLIIQSSYIICNEPNLKEIVNGLDSPWSLSFIQENKVLITEKPGNLLLLNLNNKKVKNIPHNLDVLNNWQGGMLEVLYFNKKVFISYTENLKGGNSSTSVAVASVAHILNLKCAMGMAPGPEQMRSGKRSSF